MLVESQALGQGSSICLETRSAVPVLTALAGWCACFREPLPAPLARVWVWQHLQESTRGLCIIPQDNKHLIGCQLGNRQKWGWQRSEVAFRAQSSKHLSGCDVTTKAARGMFAELCHITMAVMSPTGNGLALGDDTDVPEFLHVSRYSGIRVA